MEPIAARPAPDDPAKADSPTDLSRQSWRLMARKVVHEFTDDHCTDLAAALTYYAVLALFPSMLALVSLLGLVDAQQRTTEVLLEMVGRLGPDTAVDTFRGPIEEMARSTSAGFTLVVGLVVALWSASAYVSAFGRAMNRIYEVEEGRPYWKFRPLMMGVALLAVLLTALVALGLVLTGPVAEAVGGVLGVGDVALATWNIAKWPVVLLLVVAIVALLYYATPNVQQPRFRWLTPGAVVAILVWAAASAAFGLYVANFGRYDRTYGSLAGVVIFLLWLWITNLALLFGAEIDAELERSRELEAGIAAEEAIQLPPRDTAALDKRAAKERQYVEKAQRLRRHASVTEREPR